MWIGGGGKARRLDKGRKLLGLLLLVLVLLTASVLLMVGVLVDVALQAPKKKRGT